MARTKNTHTGNRQALLAGASTAACLAAGAIGFAALAPGAAHAANECGNPGANGSTADTFTCSGAHAAISYATQGNLTLTLQNGVTVSTGGIAITGVTGNTVTFNRSDTPADSGDPSITSTAGIALDINSANSNVAVTLTDTDSGDSPLVISGATGGVRLQTGGGTIAFTTSNGAVTTASGVGIQAINTGTGSTTVTAGATVTSAAGTAIAVQGGGAATVNVNNTVSGVTGVQGLTTGAGGLTINVNNGGSLIGGTGSAASLSPGAASSVMIGAGGLVRANGGSNAVIDVASISASRSANVNVNGGVLRSNDNSLSGYDDLVYRVAGGAGTAAMTIQSTGLMQGRVDLANTGTATISVGGTAAAQITQQSVWRTGGMSRLGDGNTTLNVYRGSLLAAASGTTTTLDFGGGADRLFQTGSIIVGQGAEGPTTLIFSSLETWDYGSPIVRAEAPIFFGSNAGETDSDGAANDRLLAPGAAFNAPTGVGRGLLIMDVDLGAATQSDCDTLTAADCLGLVGGTTTGETLIRVNDTGATPTGGYNPGIVLVDVSGAGTSADSHFQLDSLSPRWRPDMAFVDGVLDKGLFFYGLTYDEANQKHLLVGLPSTGAIEFSNLGMAAQDVWRTSTGSWFDRQADLREGMDGGSGGAVWLKMAGNFVDRENLPTVGYVASSYEYNTSYNQRTWALTGGVDLVNAAGEDTAFVFGLTAGVLNSDLQYTASSTDATLEGYSLGGYASYLAGGLYVDAIVNVNKLDVEYNTPNLGLAPLSSKVNALGAQVEAGWRIPMAEGEAVYIEPLAALSWVRAEIDAFTLPGAAVDYDDATSLRGAVGARIAGDLPLTDLTLKYAFTGRVWQEFKDPNALSLANSGPSLILEDEMDKTLGDISTTLSFFSNQMGLSGFGSLGLKFNDTYQATDVVIGVRYAW